MVASALHLHRLGHRLRWNRFWIVRFAALLTFAGRLNSNIFVAAAAPTTPPEIGMGTTLVAVKYKDGVVVAADSRTSMGSYVSNRYASKIVPISDHTVLCRAGSAADTQHLARLVQLQMEKRIYRYNENRRSLGRPGPIARWLKWSIYREKNKRMSELGVSLLVAGYDAEEEGESGGGGARIFSITRSGAMVEEGSFAVAGSGSTYILGHLDHRVVPQRTKDLDEEAAIAFCKSAVELAIHRDASSGGLVRLVVINAQGRREITFYPSTRDDRSNTEKAAKVLPGFALPARNNVRHPKHEGNVK